MDDHASLPPVPKEGDHVLVGCGVGCLCQVAFIGVAMFISRYVTNSRVNDAVGLSWGLTQWIALVPLILSQRSAGRRNLVVGLIITGCIGLLLCSACATIILR